MFGNPTATDILNQRLRMGEALVLTRRVAAAIEGEGDDDGEGESTLRRVYL